MHVRFVVVLVSVSSLFNIPRAIGDELGAAPIEPAVGMEEDIVEMEPLREQVGEIVSARERVGEQLMTILSDAEQPIEVRHEAARLLGQLQYTPAIELLIAHVDLRDPMVLGGLGVARTTVYPVMGALAAYGDAAVPQIIAANNDGRGDGRHYALALAIIHGGATEEALRYLRGIEPLGDDDALMTRKARLEELLVEQLSTRRWGQ